MSEKEPREMTDAEIVVGACVLVREWNTYRQRNAYHEATIVDLYEKDDPKTPRVKVRYVQWSEPCVVLLSALRSKPSST